MNLNEKEMLKEYIQKSYCFL